MDVYGTRFQLLQGKADWAACLEDGQAGPWTDLFWDDTCASVTLAPLLPLVAPPRANAPLDRSLRRGASADRFGNWYWIGQDRQTIYGLPRGTRQVTTLWPRNAPAAPAPASAFQPVTAPIPAGVELAGLAVTHHDYLVAGCLTAPGLLIFDLKAGSFPSLLRVPDGVPFVPFDLAPSAAGGCWVLDNANRRYWGFDRDFRSLAETIEPGPAASLFQPVDGTPALPVLPAPLPAGYPVASTDPIAIEGLPDGSVLILDGAPGVSGSLLYRQRADSVLGPAVPLQGSVPIEDDTATSGVRIITLTVTAHDIAYNADTGTLYAADHYGRQCLAFTVGLGPTLSLTLQRDYLPLHLFGGRGLVAWRHHGAAAIAHDVAAVPASDTAVRWARVAAVARADFARDAVLETPVLDGKARDCLWDGLFLDACIPPGATVQVSTCVGNDPSLVADPAAPASPQPDLYLRGAGAEIPFYDPFADRTPQPDRLGTWELLLQQVQGRYLKVRLELSGTGRVSPELKALRVYYPRFSYPRRYLPATYTDDPTSASFVERLLANPKGFYAEIEGKIRNVGVLFDPRSAPTEALDWLASWLGLTLDPLWQDIGQRLQTAAAGSSGRAPTTGIAPTAGTSTTTVTSAAGLLSTRAPTTALSSPSGPDRRRLFIRFATRLFTRRGTADGIRFALHLLLEPGLEATLRRFRLAALTPDPALTEELTRLGLPTPTPAPAYTDNDIEDLLTQYLLSPYRPSKVRLVERFMTRGGLATAAGDPTPVDNTAANTTVAATDHRFAVMIPENLPADVATMVSRIVNLEKPAHTDFEVRRYWDYFRVGEVRLGLDTMLGEDSRFLPILLGQSALPQGYLAYPPPIDAADRMVLDRDRLGAMPAL